VVERLISRVGPGALSQPKSEVMDFVAQASSLRLLRKITGSRMLTPLFDIDKALAVFHCLHNLHQGEVRFETRIRHRTEIHSNFSKRRF
jgi:Cft2 family RNA processing exonuclease